MPLQYEQAVAGSYEADRADDPLWKPENAYVERYFQGRSGAALLDVPIGTGRFLANYQRFQRIAGIDISPHMLDQARQRVATLGLGNVTLATGDAARLPEAAGAFDVIVCWRLLHLLPPAAMVQVLTELHRVLRGELLLQVYLPAPLATRLAARAGRWLRRLLISPAAAATPWSHIPSHAHTPSTIERALRSAGLRIVGQDRIAATHDWISCAYRAVPDR